MHGADWPALKEKYAAFLPHLATRTDLKPAHDMAPFRDCSGAPSGWGRRFPAQRRRMYRGGLLGADFVVDQGKYRFEKVYGGLNWNPWPPVPPHGTGGRGRGGRIPAGGGRGRALGAGEPLQPVREYGGPDRLHHGRCLTGRDRVAHRERGAGGERGGAPQPGLGRGEPRTRRRSHRRARRVRVRPQYGRRRTRVLQALFLPADETGRP